MPKFLYGLYNPEKKRLVTEGDVDNSSSDVPLLKNEDNKWKLQCLLQEEPTYELVKVLNEPIILSHSYECPICGIYVKKEHVKAFGECLCGGTFKKCEV